MLFFDQNLALVHHDHHLACVIVTLVDSHQAARFSLPLPIAECASIFFRPRWSFLIDLCGEHGLLAMFY